LRDEARDELHQLLDDALDRAPHLAASVGWLLRSVTPAQERVALTTVDVAEAGLRLLTTAHAARRVS